jgi:hypothetical protein
MKTYIYYIILFIGTSCLISEIVNDFTEMKLFYAVLEPNKYFKADELKDSLSVPIDNPANNFNIYYGNLVKNKRKGHIRGYEEFIIEISQETGNIPVWFCNIKGVNKLKFRTTKSPPNTPFANAFIYVIFWLASIYSINQLIKNKRPNEK